MSEETETLNGAASAGADGTQEPSQINDPAAVAELIVKLNAENAELKDQVLRALADADNTRKQRDRQVSEARVFAIDRFARDLLTVADTFERALAALPPETRANLSPDVLSVIEGVEMTEKTLIMTFERHGLKRVPGAGAAFDPNHHQAVAQISSPYAAGLVAQVFQAGWALSDRPLRAAMVAVSTGPGAGTEPLTDASSDA